MARESVFGPWSEHVRSFQLALRSEGRSHKTLTIYSEAITLLCQYVGGTKSLTEITTGDLRGFLGEQLAAHKPATAHNRYRALRRFFRWLYAEEEIPADPSARLSPPAVPEEVVEPYADEELVALLRTCRRDKSLLGLRDEALVWVLLDTGLRRGELLSLHLGDYDFEDESLTVRRGKGNRGRVVHLGYRAQRALDRYLRRRASARATRTGADGALWANRTGEPLTPSGLAQMLKRLGRAARVPDCRPHRFRHTSAIRFLQAEGRTTDLEILMGWRPGSPMVRRYTAATESERARESHRLRSPADTLRI